MPDWAKVVDEARRLIYEYNMQGIRPTLRQVHYRLASSQVGGYQNTQSCYKKLSEKLVKARMQGLIPWDSLADHVRYRRWNRPFGGEVPDIDELIEMATCDVGEDPWDYMRKRVILWLEKDALADLIYDAVKGLYVPLSVSRGYSSWTFVYDNLDILRFDGEVKVFYLGDFDPSGLDIERFTNEAIKYFDVEFEFRRISLTWDQVQRYGLLPNPTKKADPRAKEYVSVYGDRCWELDSLEPRELQKIVRQEVEKEIDKGVWKQVMRENEKQRQKIREELRERLEKL